MSAISPAPAPVHVPPGTLAPQAPAPPKASRRWWWIAAVVVLVGAGAALYLMRPKATTVPVAAIPTARVTTGALVTTIRVAGTTSAGNYENVMAPMTRGPEAGRPMVLEKLADSGKLVKKGEIVAQIEAAAAKDHIDDVVPMVDQAKLDIEKRKAEQSVDMENELQQLRVAKASLDKAKLDLGAAEIRAAIDQEILKLDVEEAAASYKELQSDVDQLKLVQAAELKILDITRQRQENHLNRHLHDYRRFTIRATMDGMAVLQTIFRGGEMVTISEGDSVGPGQGFMKVVDPKSMQVDATVNQAESGQLRVGQEARILLDAFPGLVLKGKVYSIAALATGGWRQQYFIRNIPVRLSIQGEDPRVIPDLSAAGDIIVHKTENATIVPLSAIEQTKGTEYVYVKNAGSFEKRAIEVSDRNNTHAAVTSGVSAGDVVRLLR